MRFTSLCVAGVISVIGNAYGAITESRTAEVQINLCEPPEGVARASGAVSDLTMKVARQDCEAIAPALIPPADVQLSFPRRRESRST